MLFKPSNLLFRLDLSLSVFTYENGVKLLQYRAISLSPNLKSKPLAQNPKYNDP